VVVNDQGATGSGGAQSDDDTIGITVQSGIIVQPSVPVVTVLENPVAGLRTVTVAPATTASFGSTTVPERSEVLVAA